MPQTRVSELTKLSGGIIGKGWIAVELTREERGLVGKLVEQPDIFSTGNLGYIGPENVKRFYNSLLRQEFEGSPKLQVRIDSKDMWESSTLAGDYYFIHEHPEDEKKYDIIVSGPILVSDVEQRKIKPEHVYEDESGIIIPITKEKIERELQKGREQVDKGCREHFVKAERLAEAGGFDFSKQIKEAREYDEARHFERYSKPENLERVLDDVEEATEFGFDWDYIEGRERTETIDEFLKLLPQLKLPKHLKPRAIAFLKAYAEKCQLDIGEEKEKIKENERIIEEIEAEKQRLLGLIAGLQK